jgi:integrase
LGSLFRPKYKSADGTVKESAVWWLKYRANGRVVRESSETDNRRAADRLLKSREGAAVEGRAVMPRTNRVTVSELADDLRRDYAQNARRSADRLALSLSHLLPTFGTCRAAQLNPADVSAYVKARLDTGAANGTVNRELAALKRLFALAIKNEKLYRRPHIEMLRENNTRQGFFERDQFDAVKKLLPEAVRPVVTFAYHTGWRVRSEVLPLQWRQVDLKAGTVRLEPGTTKNGDGRTVYMTPELRACLEGQRAATDTVQREQSRVVPYVFHRGGEAIKTFRKSWDTACDRAGLPGRILHDFRRTAVRNLERAGVPRSVAMKMVGHKTESVYRRYAIVDDTMLREAAEKQARATGA